MKLLRYLRLYKTHRTARKFYNSYEHLTRDIQFHPQMNVRLDVYSPPEAGPHPVLVFVHGGGWKRFNKELFSLAAVKLLPEKMMIVIPDHTLYPEAGYEQMAHEVAAAVSWTLDNAEKYGGDPERVVIAGHSSGGHLVGLATMDQRFLSAYGHTNDDIRGVLLISSGHDLEAQYTYEQSKGKNGATELMETMVGITGGVEKFPEASPISYVQRDLPPILILHGDADQTVPIDLALNFHASLQKVGAPSQIKVYPGRGHSELLFSALAEKRAQLVVDIAEFVHGVTQSSASIIDKTPLPVQQTHIQLHESLHAMIAHESENL